MTTPLRQPLPSGLLDFPVIGILRGFTYEQSVRAVQTAWSAGLHLMEVTLDTPQSCEIIATLRTSGQKQQHSLIGAGTVTTLEEAVQAHQAGAEFLVTPVAEESIVRYACEQGLPVFPGAFTPTEVHRMWQAGATAVKLFPASVLGLDYFKALRGPLSQVAMLPTGGMDLMQTQIWLRAGAVGAGVGSPLFRADWMSEPTGKDIRQSIQQWRSQIKGESVLNLPVPEWKK